MKAAKFAKDTLLILGTNLGGAVLSMLSSIILARTLGPGGRGIYALAVLFSYLIITFANLGLGPATVYYVAQKKYPYDEILGNNILIILGLSLVGGSIGFVSLFALQDIVFPEVPRTLLLLSLLLVPLDLFRQQSGSQILLGAVRIREFNLTSIVYALLLLIFVYIATKILGLGAKGALWANILSSLALCILLLHWLKDIADGISFSLNESYIRETVKYGTQAYLSNIIGFLNYRVEVFLLSVFLSTSAVGFYSVAIGLAEALWLVSKSAATLIFPVVSAEKDDEKRKTFTPFISRTVLLITATGAAVLFIMARWFIPFLYSKEYSASVNPFRILLPGIIFLSAARILANDIAGRGKPMLNTYVGAIGFSIQVLLNFVLVPRFGVAGSAWASTITYGVILAIQASFYAKVSGNLFFDVMIPKRSDWRLYLQMGNRAWQQVKKR